MSNKWIKISIALFAIIFLILLAIDHKSRVQHIQSKGHELSILISLLKERHNDINRKLLEGMLYQYYNNDKINKNIKQFQSTIDAIESSEIFSLALILTFQGQTRSLHN